jgi:hypothetical protein
MSCHIGSHATTTAISSYMIYQSYWKMHHWQSEHECGTYMMVLRAVRDVLSNTYHDGWIGRGGPTAWPPRSPDFSEFVPVRTHESPCVCRTLDNEEALHHRIERMRRSMMRRVEACTESRGEHFEHLLEMYTFSYNSQIKCFRTHVDMGISSYLGMWKGHALA